jgi:glycosyltransferase involved in cell wall biosynthesis
MREDYIPQNQRKKILLLCDDIRMHSGIATMAREFVSGLAHKYNWAQIAGSTQHPEKGKILNLDKATTDMTGIPDPYVRLYPTDGYGNPDILREVMNIEKPDAILHFTDPRFWIWLYQIERDLRQKIPIGFYSIWDDLPYPMYNRAFYESCDWIGCISKQTKNIVECVLNDKLNKPTQVTYVPHGINVKNFRPLTTEQELKDLEKVKKEWLKGKDYKFILYYNSRNIRRKQTSSILLAWRVFCDNLSKEEADKCVLMLHTQPMDEAGTDLLACKEAFCPNSNVIFSTDKVLPERMNQYYNIADVTIHLSDNEGFGIATAESITAGTPIIVSVTGGLQDQCGFVDENGSETVFTPEWGSNSDGRYKTHGKWVTPVYPSSRMVQGSIPTPYILADYAKYEDAAEAILYWYLIGRDKRKECGQAGREWITREGGLNAENMCKKMAEGLDGMMTNWKGRERFNIHRQDEVVSHAMPGGNLGLILPKFNREEVLKKFSNTQ